MYEENKKDREKRREERRREERCKKLKLKTFGGTLVIAASIAMELFGTNIAKPLDVGYYFTSDDVRITQLGDDYTDKNYKVKDSNGKFINFSFDNLEQIEPNVNGGYTRVPDNYLPNGSHLSIQRKEDNPVKTAIQGGVLITFLGGSLLTGSSIYEQNKMKEERRR